MKRGMWCIGFVIIANGVFAQTWAEWTRQQKTQIDYLYKQIAALQVYIELGQKGYGIYQDGLTLIGDLKHGEFTLHHDYFSSLSSVKPSIARSPKMQEVVDWYQQVLLFHQRIQRMELGKDKASLMQLFDGVLKEAKRYADQMDVLVSDGQYQLTDLERMEQINNVHVEMKDLYVFARSVYGDAAELVQQSKGTVKDEQFLRSFHGIN